MKRRLTISLALLFLLFVFTVVFGLPAFGGLVSLGIYQKLALFFVIICGFVVLISLTIDLCFSLPLKIFLKNLSDVWRKNHIVPIPTSALPVELVNINGAFQDILSDSIVYMKSLESKAGLSEGHSQIITMVAHQMRTPISGLKWMLTSMLDGEHKPEDTHLIKEAVEAADRVSDIVEELLRGIGLEQGLAKEHHSNVDMVKAVNSVITETSLIARSNNVSIVFNKDAVIPLVEGNEQELRFAIHTLVSNAVHYSPSGSTVTLSLTISGQTVRLEVIDHGIGIAKNEQAMIFTKFGRSKESINKYPNGTGLSLFLTKSIIINHKGDLTYTSEEGKGSVFVITLPVRGKGELETFIRY